MIGTWARAGTSRGSSVLATLLRPGPCGYATPVIAPLSSRRGAYEYGTREPMPGITPRPLPEG
jgi:hypothetical protein